MKLRSAPILSRGRLGSFGMDVQDVCLVLMESYQMRKGAHDRLQPIESRAISLRHAEYSYRRLPGSHWLLKLNRITAAILSPWPDLLVGLGIFLINLDAARQVFSTARDEHKIATNVA